MANALVNWANLPSGPLWLTPPNLSPWQTEALARIRERVPNDPDVVWVLSSGTESVNQVKCLGLTREAILASAAAVNEHLRANARDRWLVAIPQYHVGGFAIAARAHLSQSAVDRLPEWSAQNFVDACARFGTTLCSLVPTQVHDLVAAGVRAPETLRAIVVGGGALDPNLYLKARALGWPTLPSYGLTETASQVATASLTARADHFPSLEVLPHAEIELREGRVYVRATSLAHLRAVANELGDVVVTDPREDGWLVTEDLAEWSEGHRLTILGRRDDVVKVLGVLVSVPQVQSDLLARVDDPARVVVLAAPDARAGAVLMAFTDSAADLNGIARAVEAHNLTVAGPQRIANVVWVPEIPRTSLGKVRRAELLTRLDLL